MFSLDDVMIRKEGIYHELTVKHSQFIKAKINLDASEIIMNSAKYSIIKDLPDLSKAKFKDQIDAAIFNKMEKVIIDTYNECKSKYEVLKMEINLLDTQSKELSDIIIAYGIKSKREAGFSAGERNDK